MPLALVLALNCAVGLLVAWVAEEELRASSRGPWQTRAAKALLLHQCVIAVPLAGWWLWRAPDWAVAYLAHAARAPSLAIGAIALANGALGALAFAIGARQVTAHRAEWLPRAAAALAALALFAVLLGRRRFFVVTSYVHFRGGLGPTPGDRVSAPWAILLALVPWASAAAGLLWSLRARRRALTLRNRG